MAKEQNLCCDVAEKKDSGLLKGILYSFVPHTFCIVFILFSVIGSVAATAVLKKFLVIPYFFTFLMIASFSLATCSAFLYLKKSDCLCVSGVKRKWKYLVVLYSIMILINLAMFTIVFPVLANINGGATNRGEYDASLSMAVGIPCSGHADLIINELKKDEGVGQVTFRLPNIFDIKYDSAKTSLEKIFSMEIFKTYKATIE